MATGRSTEPPRTTSLFSPGRWTAPSDANSGTRHLLHLPVVLPRVHTPFDELPLGAEQGPLVDEPSGTAPDPLLQRVEVGGTLLEGLDQFGPHHLGEVEGAGFAVGFLAPQARAVSARTARGHDLQQLGHVGGRREKSGCRRQRAEVERHRLEVIAGAVGSAIGLVVLVFLALWLGTPAWSTSPPHPIWSTMSCTKVHASRKSVQTMAALMTMEAPAIIGQKN